MSDVGIEISPDLDLVISISCDSIDKMLDPAQSSRFRFGLMSDRINLLAVMPDGTWSSDARLHLNTEVVLRVHHFARNQVAFQVANGLFLGRIVVAGRNPIRAIKPSIDEFCKFTVERRGDQVALKADNGLYLSRINYGGIRDTGGRNIVEAAKATTDEFTLFRVCEIDRFCKTPGK